jgi:DNA polymerase I-like protein with 3'-5' exonuclease and polymerase domains
MTPKVLVGHDASGLELRMLAHYLNDHVYTKVITEGDPHEYHRGLLKLDTRDAAKEFIYKFNYGAGGILIGISVYSYGELIGNFSPKQIAGAMTGLRKRANKFGMVNIGKKTFVPVSEEIAVFLLAGDALKKTFLRNNPGLESLIERVQDAGKRGWLLGLDGRRIYLRRDLTGKVQVHKALNTLMQSAGSVVMKHSIVLLDQYIREEGLSSKKVIDMHDEAQFECLPEEADRHGELAVKSIIKAGELLELNCKLDAEYKVGNSWANTH